MQSDGGSGRADERRFDVSGHNGCRLGEIQVAEEAVLRWLTFCACSNGSVDAEEFFRCWFSYDGRDSSIGEGECGPDLVHGMNREHRHAEAVAERQRGEFWGDEVET